jgi:uncharacterized protein YqhQ
MAKVNVGGQAIIEGVMMRAGKSMAMAARRPDGKIVVQNQEVRAWADRFPPLKWPWLRGTLVLFESMLLGLKALEWSGQQAMAEEPAEGSKEKAAVASKSDRVALVITLGVGFGLGILLFVVVPYYGAQFTAKYFSSGQSRWTFNALNGGIKVTIFLLYLWMMSWVPDLRRVFMYHGAEHKSIFAWEAGQGLELPQALDKSRFHPRCSTAFLLMVMVVSIITFAVILPRHLKVWERLGGEMLLLLPIAGVTYELQRFSAKYQHWAWVRLLFKPGLALQALTTREPEPAQVEVALAALKSVLAMEEKRLGTIEPEEAVCGTN